MEIYPRKPIKISSPLELDREMKRVHALFLKKETDETWELFSAALANVKRWVEQDGAHELDGFGKHLKLLQKGINHALLSERTRLSGTAVELIKALATSMQRDYEPFHDLFHASLIRMLARTKKVIVAQALDCLRTVIAASKLPRLIPRFAGMLGDSSNNQQQQQHPVNNSTLTSAATCLELSIHANAVSDIQPRVERLEAAIRAGVVKPSAEVRAAVRACFQAYASKMPEHAARFENGLTDQEKKHLKPPLIRKSSSASSCSSVSSSLAARGRASLPSMRQPIARPAAGRHSAPQPGIKPQLQTSTASTRRPLTSSSSSSSSSNHTRKSTAAPTATPSSTRKPVHSHSSALLRKTATKAQGSVAKSRVPVASSRARVQSTKNALEPPKQEATQLQQQRVPDADSSKESNVAAVSQSANPPSDETPKGSDRPASKEPVSHASLKPAGNVVRGERIQRHASMRAKPFRVTGVPMRAAKRAHPAGDGEENVRPAKRR